MAPPPGRSHSVESPGAAGLRLVLDWLRTDRRTVGVRAMAAEMSSPALGDLVEQFDHRDPRLTGATAPGIYAALRERGPVVRSDKHGGFWILTRYRRAKDVGLTIEGGDFAYIGLGLILQIGLALLVWPLSNLLFPEGRPPQELAEVIAGADTAALQVALVAAAVVLGPVTEELMYRGVLLKALSSRGKVFALLVSSAVFALVHLTGLDTDTMLRSAAVVLPPFFILGLVLAWLTQRHGRLGPAIFLHSGWNLLSAFVLLLPADVLEQVG